MDTSSLDILVKELEDYMAIKDKTAPQISDKDVAWHIAHSLKVIQVVIQAMIDSDPNRYKSSFNIKKALVMATGWIPRGGGKAPKPTRPEKEEMEEASLRSDFDETRMLMAVIFKKTQENSYLQHPYFGMLNREETMKFLDIHTKHHLKIIKDIDDKAWSPTP